MSWEGRWITGESGAERLSELRGKLDSGDIALTDQTGAFRLYAPWMSAARLRIEQHSTPYPLENLIARTEPRVVTDDAELKALAGYFTRHHYSGLQIIGNDPQSFLKIENGSHPWIEQTKALAPAAIRTALSVAPSWALRLRSLCQLIVPLGSSDPLAPRRDVGRGLSTHLFRGCVFIDPPFADKYRAEAYAINLAHELGHQALIVYQSADAIIDGPLDAPVYSVIRRTDRPAVQSFHAVIAAAYMAEFVGDWLIKLGSVTPNVIYLRGRLKDNIQYTEAGVTALSKLNYTDLGQQILHELLDLSRYLRSVHGI